MPAGTDGRQREGADWRGVADIVDAPGFALPWLDRFYDESDAALLEALAGGEVRGADLLDVVEGLDMAAVRRAHRRAVATMSDEHDLEAAVAVAPFWDRFEYWITFEGWGDIPPEVRGPFADGCLEKYIGSIGAAVADVAAGRSVHDPTGNDFFVLLDEAEDIVRGARRVFLRPCICRRIDGRCDKPVDVCIWLDDDERGAGREISRERAIELLHEADRAGLMFTANDPQAGNATWICCCCRDCCQPLLAAARLDATAVWPQRRHVAAIDRESCTSCRVCVERCPWGVLTMKGKGNAATLALDEDGCRGCGVCATGCEPGAITLLARG
jgi:NAD-dependent dihydropyrimidine dehydrogenase PreA subunit